MSMVIVPKYSNIYPDEKIPDLIDLLKDTPSRLTLGILSFINGAMYIDSGFNNQCIFISQLIGRMPQKEIENFNNQLDKFVNKFEGHEINVFPLYTVLQLMEWEICNFRDIDFEHSTSEQEYNILKAVLIFNEQMDREHKDLGSKGRGIYEIIWPAGLPQAEFLNRKIFLNAIPNSLNLLDYFEKKYPEQLKEYLDFLNVKSKEEIFKNILLFFLNGYRKETKDYHNHFPIEVLSKNRILEPLALEIESLDLKKYKSDGNDKYFKGLRKWPLIKYGKDYFDVLNWNFVSDKLSSNALIFDFFCNTSLEERINFSDYKSDIGFHYSEKISFIQTIKRIFSDKEYIHLTPNDNENINVDYYLRFENKIFLFEYKDYIMPDQIKNGSFIEIKEYFDTRFIRSKTGKPKGISQLENQLDTLYTNPQSIEDYNLIGLGTHRFMVFPIIVVKDQCFSIPGLNEYLNTKFLANTATKRYNFHLLNGLTIIELDTILDFEDMIRDKKAYLQSLLYDYHTSLAWRRTIHNRYPSINNHLSAMGSFRTIIANKTINKDITETTLFNSVVERLGIKNG